MKPERLSDARVASITKKESGFSVPFLERFIKCLKSISDELLNETIFFLYGFFSQTFSNHKTAGEGGGHFNNGTITSESLPLHIAYSRTTRIANRWFPSASR